jgi:conjugal transfer ATP-binding protein TraC
MYEIPQQLEYKEKIIFGLTFSQLAYALIFFPIVFSLIFKLDARIEIRVILATLPSLLAVGFMFFDLMTQIKNWYSWFKSREVIEPEKIKSNLGIGEIKDNFIYCNNKKIAVLKVDSINFGIKPQKEQETITLAFQKFLNSIDFPIQILMTTETLDLDIYLRGLQKRVLEGKKKEIFESYKSHMKDLIEKNSAMNRNFYVVIPETTDIVIQIKLCEDRLHSLNLKTYRLHNKQLTKMFSKIFDSGKESLPEMIKHFPDYLEIDRKFHKIIYAHGYPRSVEKGFLDRLVSCSGNFDFSLHINPQLIEQTLILLNKELQKQRADLYSAQIKNQFNPSLEIKYRDTKGVLENLQKGNEKLFNIGFYINCRADSLEELKLLTKKIESELNSLLIIPRQPNFRMLQGFKSCLPLAKDFIGVTRNITTSALSAFFPFTSSFFKFDDTGIWFGLNKNQIPIIRDIFKLSNSNGMCLASSGAGKSYMTKLFITRHLLNGTKVMVVDPQGEYKNLVKKFEGQRIDLSRTSDTIINPLDLMGHDYAEKRLSLMDLMPVMLGQLTEPQKSFIDQALTEAYERKGIYMNDRDSWNNEPPILGDVLKSLEKLEKKAINLEKSTLRSLINRLKLYVDGVFSFMNRHTNIDFRNNFVCFDIGNMPKQVKPVIMFLVLDYVYMKMKRDIERKILVIDEAWSLLSRAEEASYIFEIVKTCRKFNMGLFLINQEVEGMLNSEAGRSALANSSYTILLRQKPAVIDSVQKTFHLSNVERIALLTAGVGEGILLIEDEHSELKIIASKEEHKHITTNADELLKVEPVENKKGNKIEINVDESIRVHPAKNLTKAEINYLLKKRFREETFKSLSSNKKEKYLVKPRFNETPKHLFVTYDLANYLEKSGIKVELYVTKKPDIVFKIGKKRYAIEVETGAVLTKIKNMREKVRLLNKNYDKWFFVVTNRNKVKNYKKFGDSVDLRYLKKKLANLRREMKKSHSA